MHEQVHSDLVGLNVSAGHSDETQRLSQLTHHFLNYDAATQTASAHTMATFAHLIRHQAR